MHFAIPLSSTQDGCRKTIPRHNQTKVIMTKLRISQFFCIWQDTSGSVALSHSVSLYCLKPIPPTWQLQNIPSQEIVCIFCLRIEWKHTTYKKCNLSYRDYSHLHQIEIFHKTFGWLFASCCSWREFHLELLHILSGTAWPVICLHVPE